MLQDESSPSPTTAAAAAAKSQPQSHHRSQQQQQLYTPPSTTSSTTDSGRHRVDAAKSTLSAAYRVHAALAALHQLPSAAAAAATAAASHLSQQPSSAASGLCGGRWWYLWAKGQSGRSLFFSSGECLSAGQPCMLKGLSHHMDFAFYDMDGYRLSLGLKRGYGNFVKNFLSASVTFKQKLYFSW